MKVFPLRRVRAALLTTGLLVALGAWPVVAQAAPPDPPAEGKVYVCHATSDLGDATQHFNLLEISINAAFKDNGGHFTENGSPQDGHELDVVLVEPGGSLPPGVPTGVPHKEGLTCEDATTTPVTFRSFTASRSAKAVTLRWKTGTELDTLGFNVYVERNGQRVKLNRSLIAGKGVQGGSYAFKTRAAKKPTRYWIEVVDLDGRRTFRSAVAR